MNRAELVEALAERSELTKAQTARLLDAVLEVITATIAAGEQVALIGFGTFKRALRAAREGRNPATGATLKIAAAKLPKFAAGATLKAAVAGKKTAPKKTTPKSAAKKAETNPPAKKPAAKKAEAKPAAKKPAAKKK
jgi:DNA-binding protein HU-beta